MDEKERIKSAVEFMPSIGSGESAASWTSIIKQSGDTQSAKKIEVTGA